MTCTPLWLDSQHSQYFSVWASLPVFAKISFYADHWIVNLCTTHCYTDCWSKHIPVCVVSSLLLVIVYSCRMEWFLLLLISISHYLIIVVLLCILCSRQLIKFVCMYAFLYIVYLYLYTLLGHFHLCTLW